MRIFGLVQYLIVLIALFPVAGFAATADSANNAGQSALQSFRVAQSVSCGGTCGKAQSCRDAVYLWCVCGYSRADRDGDGVPCEKVCGQSNKRNLEKVRAIMKDLGCR